LVRAHTIAAEQLEPYLAASPVAVQVVDRDPYDLIAAADLALVKSGTATLECALLGCPMVIAYRLSPVTAALGRLLVREPEHRVAPGPEVAPLGAAAERSLEGVAVRVDEAGDREPVRHVATLSASPHLSWPVPPTSSPMRSYRGKAHVSVAKREQIRSNRSPALYP